MSSSPRSPKRRRILSSINPHGDRLDKQHEYSDARQDSRRRRGETRGSTPISEHDHDDDRQPQTKEEKNLKNQSAEAEAEKEADYSSAAPPRATKFRFKSSSSRSHPSSRHRRDKHGDDDDEDANKGQDINGIDNDIKGHHHRHRHRHREHRSDPSRPRRHHRRHRPRSPSPPPAPDPFAPGPLDPEAAFRESLFDAMADDEGAAYWESVYGQPIHVYASERDRGGELERMTDEEYAAHVRQRMWEKTHAGLVEERARRIKASEEAARQEEEAARVRIEVERSLRRGEERRKKRGWRERWEGYRKRWAEWDGRAEGLPWPEGREGSSGGGGEAVRAFFVNGLGLEELGEKEFAAALKDERVRWHPDKMQQRLGGEVDAAVMRNVTAIFQVIDALWNDIRKGAS